MLSNITLVNNLLLELDTVNYKLSIIKKDYTISDNDNYTQLLNLRSELKAKVLNYIK